MSPPEPSLLRLVRMAARCYAKVTFWILLYAH